MMKTCLPFVVACLLLLGACSIADAGGDTSVTPNATSSQNGGSSPDEDIAPDAEEPNQKTEDELLAFFREVYPDKEIVLLSMGDCNDDGLLDLVIVYRENKDKNHMVTVYSHEGGYLLTHPIPAPYEDVKLEWEDIDRIPPTELIISGKRGIHFGLGVFRFVDGEWIDLFGGMEECC